MDKLMAPGLFTPYRVGHVNLSHRVFRVVLAPMIRNRVVGGVPGDVQVEYYTQRTTDGGLLISEGTRISETATGSPQAADIYTEEHVKTWNKVVQSVHANGGIFFCQLWHVGRASHSIYQPGGCAPVSSTNHAISTKWPMIMPDQTLGSFGQPRAMTKLELLDIIEDYGRAATNAIRAGFDGVEIHAGHGYLIDQFLKDAINDRTDEYGVGSIENRCRFLLEILKKVVEVAGIERVALRISPAIDHNDATDSDPLNLGLAIIERLNAFQEHNGSKLAYLHITRPRFSASGTKELGINGEEDEARLMRAWRRAYKGSFMSTGGFDREEGMKTVADGDADLISYGRLFISNPDLVRRFKINAPLNKGDPATFFRGDLVVGYTDYPFLETDNGHDQKLQD